MSGIVIKDSQTCKEAQKHTHNQEEKNKTNKELTQTVEVAKKDLKTFLVAVFFMLKILSRCIETIRESQIKILDRKTTMPLMENKLKWINGN